MRYFQYFLITACLVTVLVYIAGRTKPSATEKPPTPSHHIPTQTSTHPPVITQSAIGKKVSPPHLTKQQQRWALATTAILAEVNGDHHDQLGCTMIDNDSRSLFQDLLRDGWRVTDRASLLDTLEWLETEGHRSEFARMGKDITAMSPMELATIKKRLRNDEAELHRIKIVQEYYGPLGERGILGWDLIRYITVCRWGYAAGYLSEAEAWQCIMPMARELQQNFHSWKELGQNYLIGRDFWSYTGAQVFRSSFYTAFNRLCTEKSSPWVTLPWNLDLGK